ncbi:unnamed protein product (macronuclear) [Paramecium tetraurelia]|uniref:Peptidase M14 domain-containing protein n=1 Tax=Paramecium tetraurelia TaxID=5888 RepID=A0EF61_PARTE|nr:uncharacterized protein GSPATT00026275001 [Paramecium tetraurelia]CAK93952.1 unnamed protein product [Paramecium tetraurelia]|eukprot:XP_001461325.1 hypothetical protein (macronuclear) [Paramecium tetraurelia strain d4-2]
MKESKYQECQFEGDSNARLLPQAIDHIDKNYSLENDMVLGWVPAYYQEEIINLQFSNELNDLVIEFQQQKDPNKIVYLGQRPNDAMQFHNQISAQSNYAFKNNKSKKIKNNKNQYLFVGMNPNIDSQIKFNSQFESGNLDLVIWKSESEYDLYMRVDTNTNGHTLWYYFEVTGLKNQEQITFNICNFRKKKCLYERGMKPYVQRESQEWQQEGENVKYGSYKCQFKDIKKQYYCLTFTLMNKQGDDTLKIAYCIPYTFSKLNTFIKTLNSQYMEQSYFCCTLSGVQVPKLTFSKGGILKKKVIVIQARIHPGESNSSWVMQGLLEHLSSGKGEKLLDQLVFVIVPMMNVDGVIFGNYRTGCAGRDLNRQFRDSNKKLYPTVYAMKHMMSDLYQIYGDQIVAFIDIHGHSAKKNAFLYGPEFQLWNCNYYKSRLFAKILSLKTQIFRYYSCLFRINECKINTARAVFCEKYQFINCFTLEVSNSSYYYDQITVDFTEQKLIELGQIIAESFNDFIIHFQEIDELFSDFKEKKTKRQTKKKGNNQQNEENQLNLQIICQNSKYSKLFEEMKNDQPDLSFSEGESDSERESDDLDDEVLKNVVLTQNQQKQIKNSKKLQKLNDLKKKSIRGDNNNPTVAKNTVLLSRQSFLEDQPNNIIQYTQNYSINRRTKQKQYKQDDIIKDNSLPTKYRIKSNNTQHFRGTTVGSFQSNVEQMSNQEKNKSPIKLKVLIQDAQLKEKPELNCEINEENMADKVFYPYIKKQQQNQKNNTNIQFAGDPYSPTRDLIFLNEFNDKEIFYTHLPTDQSYNQNISAIYNKLNKNFQPSHIQRYNKIQKFQTTQNPSINLRNTLQMSKLGATENSYGVSIKPKLFASLQVDEAIEGQTEQCKSAMNQYQSTSIPQKQQKQFMQSSFYQIQKNYNNAKGMQQYLFLNN